MGCAAVWKKFRNSQTSPVGAFDTIHQYIADGHGVDGFIFYTRLGWGTKEVPTLVAALEYAEAHCRPKDEKGKKDAKVHLQLRGNKFTEERVASDLAIGRLGERHERRGRENRKQSSTTSREKEQEAVGQKRKALRLCAPKPRCANDLVFAREDF